MKEQAKQSEETKQALEADLGMTWVLEISDEGFKISIKHDPVRFSNV